MQTIQILIADDHEIIGESLSLLLSTNAHLKIRGNVKSGKKLLNVLQETTEKIDIIIMDIEMPELNGIDASRIIRKQYPEIGIIILSNHVKNIYVQELSSVGIHGYLHKDVSIDQLIRTIFMVYNGGTHFDRRVVNQLVDFQKEYSMGKILSDREKEVLCLIAKEHTNKEISGILNVAPATVDFHRRKLYEKTGAKNTAGLTRFAIAEGFVSL